MPLREPCPGFFTLIRYCSVMFDSSYYRYGSPGLNHTNGILQTNPAGSVVVKPGYDGTVGTDVAGSQTGHCIQVNADTLACYFQFDVTASGYGTGKNSCGSSISFFIIFP
jgi:hypothetical protein